jgi:hypothetical protein
MQLSIGGLATKIAELEAKLDYYDERLSEEIGPPNEVEIMRRIQEEYPAVDANSLDEIDPANLAG